MRKQKFSLKTIVLIMFAILGLIFTTLFVNRIIINLKQEKIIKELTIKVNSDTTKLQLTLNSYPPRFKNDSEKMAINNLLDDTITTIGDLEIKDPQNFPIYEAKKGELYRYAHNLDRPEAWNLSEMSLKTSLNLKPNYVPALISLGRLYVNSDIFLAPKAEKLFLTAIKYAKGQELLEAYDGLFFAYYYQFKYKKALEIINKALIIAPQDKSFLKLRSVVIKVIERQ